MDANGSPAGLVAVARDITERKRAEEELRNLSRRVIETQESERLRVARELHDGINQVIASVDMRLRKVESGMAGLNPAGREILRRCSRLWLARLKTTGASRAICIPASWTNWVWPRRAGVFARNFNCGRVWPLNAILRKWKDGCPRKLN